MSPFQRKISGKIQLPSLAKNIPILIQALEDDDLTYRQLTEVIKQYPAVSARLIFLTNSPWSSPITPITCIEQACARLGTSIVKSLSIAISISASFDTRKCPSFKTEHFWTTSILVAEGAGLLASTLPNCIASVDFKNTTYTAGLLHNLGLLWLADNLPNETEKAFQDVRKSPLIPLNSALKQHTGTDYYEAGDWVGKQMKFPEVLNVAIKHHHTDNYQNISWETALLIGVAADMVTSLHEQSDNFSTSTRLEFLGVNTSSQNSIFQQLSKDFEKTRELAKTLF
ncbi:MAG: HDOD domain-containing protein [Methylococcaceae bacterium]|nr:HDOD domain-containing protein [Methylococcaceae bacterium]